MYFTVSESIERLFLAKIVFDALINFLKNPKDLPLKSDSIHKMPHIHGVTLHDTCLIRNMQNKYYMSCQQKNCNMQYKMSVVVTVPLHRICYSGRNSKNASSNSQSAEEKNVRAKLSNHFEITCQINMQQETHTRHF